MGTLKRNNGLVRHSILLRALHLPLKDVDAAVEALIQSDEIERVVIKSIVYYKTKKCNSDLVSHDVVYKGKEEELYKSQEMRDSLYTPASATNHYDTSCKDASVPVKPPCVVVEGAKAKHKPNKRKCHQCNREFPYDLNYHYNGDQSGFECSSCFMGQPVTEKKVAAKTKKDIQKTL